MTPTSTGKCVNLKKKIKIKKKTTPNIEYHHRKTSNILYSDKMGYKIHLRIFPKIVVLEIVKKYIAQYIFCEI
jgi:hypothetical protein